MKNIIMLIKFTFREMLAKKIMITILILSVLTVIAFALAFYSMGEVPGITNNKILSAEIKRDMIIEAVKMLEYGVSVTLFIMGLFVSIFATAGLVPDLLKKGNIDLFLSKPISKFQLLTGKYIGAVSVVFLNIVFLIGSIWFMIGLKFAYWDISFLYSIFSITFVFAAIYALMTLISILTNSSVLSMIISFLIIIVINPLLGTREDLFRVIDNSFVEKLIDGFYYIIPQSSEIIGITQESIMGNEMIYAPLFSTGILLIIYYALSIYFFQKKDF